MTIELNPTPSIYDRTWRLNENENWQILMGIFKEGIDKTMSNEAIKEIIDLWLQQNDFKPKEAVTTFAELPIPAELKEIRGVIDENAVYWFDGTNWVKQSNMNFDGISDVKNTINSDYINVLYPPAPHVGAKGDGVTDDTQAIQNLINIGKGLYFPTPPAHYKVSTLTPLKEQTLLGESKWKTKIKGTVNAPVIRLGDDANTKRYITLKELSIINDYGPALQVIDSNDFTLDNVYTYSNGSTGTEVRRSYRGKIDNCKFVSSKGAAFKLYKSNAIEIGTLVCTGGSLGTAAEISQVAALSIGNMIIESSLTGLRIAANAGDIDDGNCSGINIKSLYIEQSKVPLELATKNSIFGLSAESLFISNANTDVIPARDKMIKIGRVKNSQIKNLSLFPHSTETVFDLFVDNTDTMNKLDIVNVNLNTNPANVYSISGSLATSSATLKAIGRTCNFEFMKGFAFDGHSFFSQTIQANVGTPIMAYNNYSNADLGGGILAIEIYNKNGDLTGAKLQIGRTTSMSFAADVDLGSLNYVNGFASIPVSDVAKVAMFNNEPNLFRVIAGTGTGTFNVKIKYKIL
ncbi:Pectate lyase superfamily protein [Macrococcoides canis]|uniref:Pectate lyase superfamily protein n=1 Tax=Macrococcoides canis TaxID=1855823 RepID=A0A1W7ACJ0_9STAP|nr:glycosyl hydrolase family 28-related protein [Macrococcus canis]ARQ07281.1 Pectate lyase superfamily protein [Macrococcus canis]